MECCSQTIFLLWPTIAAVGEILWSPAPQPNDDDANGVRKGVNSTNHYDLDIHCTCLLNKNTLCSNYVQLAYVQNLTKNAMPV